MPGKTPMWGNPTRERERYYYSASGKYSTATKSHFQPREIPHSHKNSPKIFCLGKRAQVRTAVQPPLLCALKTVPNRVLYDLHSTTQQQQGNSKNLPRFSVPKGASKTMPSFLLYGLYGSVQYDPTQKNRTTLTQKNALGFVPSFFLGNVPSKLLTFLSQAYSENLSQSPPLVFSMCLAHYPMHSFINLKMTFSLQSVFSPSPTLNPKAKIRSCLFQDQGS
jgi:hypothetical protein